MSFRTSSKNTCGLLTLIDGVFGPTKEPLSTGAKREAKPAGCVNRYAVHRCGRDCFTLRKKWDTPPFWGHDFEVGEMSLADGDSTPPKVKIGISDYRNGSFVIR